MSTNSASSGAVKSIRSAESSPGSRARSQQSGRRPLATGSAPERRRSPYCYGRGVCGGPRSFPSRWAPVECHPFRPPFGSGRGRKPAAGAFKAADAPRCGRTHHPRQTSPAGLREGWKPCWPAGQVCSSRSERTLKLPSLRRFLLPAPEGRAGRGRLEPSVRP